MDKQAQSRAPLIVAVVLLLLPVLYVGSYLVLVMPAGRATSAGYLLIGDEMQNWQISNYRFDGKWLANLYWPLEQIDRKVRPGSLDHSVVKSAVIP
jgi:hypothetical protein